jgi:hypothetical protein
MRTAIAVLVVVSIQIGCAPRLEGGLANAPTLGGVTPETRVHDAVANGRDSCERSAFPQGEVLRGQVPPCVAREKARLSAIGALAPVSAPEGTWMSSSYPRGLCPSLGPGLARYEKGTDDSVALLEACGTN